MTPARFDDPDTGAENLTLWQAIKHTWRLARMGIRPAWTAVDEKRGGE